MTPRRPWCACAHKAGRSVAILNLLTMMAGVLIAQDPFEIHVLEYEQLHPAEFTFENHTNYVRTGATDATQGQLHITYELTAGITNYFSLGVMQLNARAPGTPLESAGWRLVPHVYIPRSWHWPLDVGFAAEFSFNNPVWAPDSRSVELLTILEKHLGQIEIDLNPEFSRSLREPDENHGWGFGLAARLGFESTKRFTPSLEYYSDWGPLSAFTPVDGQTHREQTHQIFPGGDIRLAENVVWNIGVGVGVSSSTDRLVLKSRLEISFGGKRKH